jgi:hypothetical protein
MAKVERANFIRASALRWTRLFDRGHENGRLRRNLPVQRGFGEGRLTTRFRGLQA